MSYYISAHINMGSENSKPQVVISVNGDRASEPINFFGLMKDEWVPIIVKKQEKTILGNQIFRYDFKNRINYDNIKRVKSIDADGITSETHVTYIPASSKNKK